MRGRTTGQLPARPQSIRAMNEILLLGKIHDEGTVSRADLARMCRLSKPTVSLALANLERARLIRPSGVRVGLPGPAAILYELRPEAGFVMALDVGRQYLRGAVSDFSGAVRTRISLRVRGAGGPALVAELIALSESLRAAAGLDARQITQTVLGSPGVHDQRRDVLALTGTLTGWDAPVLRELRQAFGASLMIENDVDAAALAELEHGYGRGVDSFGFVSVGTGIGMGLVLEGKLHRGNHGAAGEIGFLPFEHEPSSDARDARRRGSLEAAASAAGIVRSARRAGMGGPISARRVFAAAAEGDQRAAQVVAAEAVLVAKAICAVITVVDPGLIVLGGGVGRAAGFVDVVRSELAKIAPVQTELKASALGDDAVVDGCLAAGTDRVWQLVRASLSDPTGAGDVRRQGETAGTAAGMVSHVGRTPGGTPG